MYSSISTNLPNPGFECTCASASRHETDPPVEDSRSRTAVNRMTNRLFFLDKLMKNGKTTSNPLSP